MKSLKIYLTAILSICLITSLFSMTLDSTDCKCQLCDFKFRALVAKSGTSFGKRLDLKPMGPISSPWLIPVCPQCNFVIFKDSMSSEEIYTYKKIVSSTEFKKAIPGNTTYYLLGKIFELEGKSSLTIAYTYLQASWEVERKKKQHSLYLTHVKRYINKYLEENKDSITDDYHFFKYFLAEILRLQSEFKEAEIHLDSLSKKSVYTFQPYRSLIEYELKLIHRRNKHPKNMPEIKYNYRDEMNTLAGQLMQKSKQLNHYMDLFEVSSLRAKQGYSSVYLTQPGCQEQWSGNFSPKVNIPCDCLAELIFPIDSNDNVIVGFPPESLINAFEEICASPFIQKIIKENSKNKLRIRAAGDRLHWNTVIVEKYRKLLQNNALDSYTMNDWVYIILEVNDNTGMNYKDYYHPVNSNLYIEDFSMFDELKMGNIFDREGNIITLVNPNHQD